MQPRQPSDFTTQPPADQVAEWAARAKEGDRAAFGRLARHFWEEIFRMLYYRVSDADDAEDLCQEVFARALARLPGLRQPESVRAWLYGIALNLARDHLRKRRLRSLFVPTAGGGQPEAADQGPGASALEAAAAKRFWQKVDAFRAGLSALQREVFTLRYMDGLSIPEISQALGRSQSAVKTHLYRAVEKFKQSPALVQELRERVP